MYPFAVHTAKNLPATAKQTEALRALQTLSALIQTYLAGRPYQFLFYVPVCESDPVQDVQVGELVLQQAIDGEFRAFLHELEIPFHILQEREAQSRLQEIMTHLEQVYHF